MKETLYNARGEDQTRIKRAFRWVVTFRDFPIDSYQTVDGDSMMTKALTLFTKGRAEFYLDGVRRGDRLPGILSSENEVVGQGGTFTLKYVEPTSRVCIPAVVNNNCLPEVRKIVLNEGETFEANGRYLVCLGEIQVSGKTFKEESTFRTEEPKVAEAIKQSILLEFLN